MGPFGASDRLSRIARLAGILAGAALLANCSGGLGKIDPRYGVAASARVVEPGEPVPKGGGVYRVGKPYTVAGRVYVPHVDPNYEAVGLASWYGNDFHGRYTANGEIFDMNAITAAHPTMPLPSYARVTNLKNHRSIIVRVNDRGPYAHDRLIDLSYKTATLLGFRGHGLAKVKVEYVGRAPLAGSDDRKLMATLRDTGPANAKPVMVASTKPYAPAYFDSRPLTELPPERPFRLGERTRVAAAHDLPAPVVAGPTTELAANAHTAPAPTPVSAYAPVRDDGHAGFMSGRGLY
jgi:rare lipoprotein A